MPLRLGIRKRVCTGRESKPPKRQRVRLGCGSHQREGGLQFNAIQARHKCAMRRFNNSQLPQGIRLGTTCPGTSVGTITHTVMHACPFAILRCSGWLHSGPQPTKVRGMTAGGLGTSGGRTWAPCRPSLQLGIEIKMWGPQIRPVSDQHQGGNWEPL